MNLDLGSLAGAFLDKDALSAVAEKAGVSTKDVTSVISQALPTLLNGASSQSSNKNTAEGFSQALLQHSGANTSNIASFLKGVDLEDGAKIVSHLLDGKTNNITDDLSKKLNLDSKQIATILSCAAPLLMSLLGKKAKESNKDNDSLSSIASSLLSNVDVGSVLNSFLKK